MGKQLEFKFGNGSSISGEVDDELRGITPAMFDAAYPKLDPTIAIKPIITSTPKSAFRKAVWDDYASKAKIVRTMESLTNAQVRDFSMVYPYLKTQMWHTSISLAKVMYASGKYHKKDIAKLSSILSKLYHNTNLLERKEERRIYFKNIHKTHQATWAYKLKE